MQKPTLPEFRTTAILLGPGVVVSLLIAAATYTPPAHVPTLTGQLWWRICMGVFGVLSALGVWGYVAPHLQGLRLRSPLYYAKIFEGAVVPAPAVLVERWERMPWLHANDIPRREELGVPAEQPMQTIDIAPGNFQEVRWAGVLMRISYTGQFRNPSDGTLGVQLRIEGTRRAIGGLTFDGGPAVDSSAGQGLHILPEGIATVLGGLVVTPGAGCVYHHEVSENSYLVCVLYVDHINPQSGVLRLNGLFASWSRPIDPRLIDSLVQHAQANPQPGLGLGGFGGMAL
jgi:hypothetical protein